MKKKALAVFLSLFLLFALCCPVFAAEYDEGEEALGGIGDQTGYLLPDDGIPVALETDRTLFIMYAESVSNLLTTYMVSGKSFTKASLGSSGSIYFSGTLTHSYDTHNAKIYAGVCYYQVSQDMFYAKFAEQFPSGKAYCSSYYSVSQLDSDKTYYGYIRNQMGSGIVSGNVHFFHFS